MKRMVGGCFGEKGVSSRGRYIRSSYIPPIWDDMRSIADITKLGASPPISKNRR